MSAISLKISNIFKLVFCVLFILGINPPNIIGDLSTFNQSPYSFGPEGRAIQDLKDFYKPNEMVSIVRYRPMVTRDKYGVIQIYTSDGKVIVSINQDGSRVFQLKGTTVEQDQDGNITRILKVKPNSNIREIRDGKGEFLGYQELAFGSNVSKEYDSSKNLTKTYEYNLFGKIISNIIDELTQTRTVFDSKGLPSYDLNYEGAIVARYNYNEYGELIYKTDNRMNRTFYFPSNGQMDRTEDQYGNLLLKYNYRADENGRMVLYSTLDNMGRTTFYKSGKPQREVDQQGNTTKEYFYDGQKLIYTYDTYLHETVWYDKDGKPTYSSVDNMLTKEWLYSKGKLVGLWEEGKNVLIAYVRGDEVGRYMFFKKPTGGQIQELIDSGVIKKNRA
ncbi:MAG: hypothetical protein NT145_03150 [Elusimicrobia bacterium]|nr:hypothetical protein [Elusimicrobiota bacterium]